MKLPSMFKAQESKAVNIHPDYYFLLWVVLDNLPLSKVEGRGFQLLMSKIAPTVKLPPRLILSRRCLPMAYKVFRQHIDSSILNEAKYYVGYWYLDWRLSEDSLSSICFALWLRFPATRNFAWNCFVQRIAHKRCYFKASETDHWTIQFRKITIENC